MQSIDKALEGLVLPYGNVDERYDVQNEVSAVAALQTDQDLLNQIVLEEKHLIKCRQNQSLLQKVAITMLYAGDEKLLVQKIAVFSHVLDSDLI